MTILQTAERQPLITIDIYAVDGLVNIPCDVARASFLANNPLLAAGVFASGCALLAAGSKHGISVSFFLNVNEKGEPIGIDPNMKLEWLDPPVAKKGRKRK